MSGRRDPACGDPGCGVSTGIDGGLTYGRGVLDDRGCWEHPCRPCAARADEEASTVAEALVADLRAGGMPEAAVAAYLADAGWLYLPAWPGSSTSTPRKDEES